MLFTVLPCINMSSLYLFGNVISLLMIRQRLYVATQYRPKMDKITANLLFILKKREYVKILKYTLSMTRRGEEKLTF